MEVVPALALWEVRSLDRGLEKLLIQTPRTFFSAVEKVYPVRLKVAESEV